MSAAKPYIRSLAPLSAEQTVDAERAQEVLVGSTPVIAEEPVEGRTALRIIYADLVTVLCDIGSLGFKFHLPCVYPGHPCRVVRVQMPDSDVCLSIVTGVTDDAFCETALTRSLERGGLMYRESLGYLDVRGWANRAEFHAHLVELAALTSGHDLASFE